MLRTFFRTFVRSILKNRSFFIINLSGFTLGIAVSILILLFVFHELSYDRFHLNSKSIYRLSVSAMIGDTRINQVNSSALVFQEMRARYPEIVNGVKLADAEACTVKYGDQSFNESTYLFADSTFFDVFTFPIIEGNITNPLGRPNSIAISESASKKYFGSESALGKTLEINNTYIGKTLYEVTAVYRDMPSNSHFHFNMVAASHTVPSLIEPSGWTRNIFVTYFLLDNNASYRELEAKFEDYVRESIGEEYYQEMSAAGSYWNFFLQPLEEIHLHSDLNNEWETNGNIRYIYIFTAIALFVLVIASINFINLSTAKGALRAREVGIRKVSGSTRAMLVIQFLGESLLLTFSALVLAIILVKLLLPFYSNWLSRELSFKLFTEWYRLPALVIIGLVVGILTGIYPAAMLSRYQPLKVLKTGMEPGSGGIGLRNILVVIQFAASIFLIICTFVVSKELSLLQRDDMGFSKKDVLIVNATPEIYPFINTFREELKRNPGVISVSESSELPGMGFSNLGFGAEGVDESFTLNTFVADEEYDETLKFEMAEGRYFSKEFPSDSSAAVLNETAVRVLGIKDPIGIKINDFNPSGSNYFTVIGVVRDYHYESLHSEIRPMVITSTGGSFGGNSRYLAVRFAPGTGPSVLSSAEKTWSELVPGTPFIHSYLEDEINKLYANEKQTVQVFAIMAALSVIVACLGLFGLASFISQQRAHEVAVRKVFGASITEVVALLLKNYSIWVFLAFVVASPVAYLVMVRWLQNFAFKVNIDPLIYLVSLAIVLVLALITIGSNTSRTAKMNPTVTLRSE